MGGSAGGNTGGKLGSSAGSNFSGEAGGCTEVAIRGDICPRFVSVVCIVWGGIFALGSPGPEQVHPETRCMCVYKHSCLCAQILVYPKMCFELGCVGDTVYMCV